MSDIKEQDFSRFTIKQPSDDDKESKIFFTAPAVSNEDKKPFFRYFTSNPLWIGVYAVLLFVAIVSGVYLFRVGGSLENIPQKTAPTSTPVPTTENTPISMPTAEPIDISSYSVTVLNGSGIAGEAGRIKKLLEDGGFTVSKTGNADRYDYEKTEVYMEPVMPAQVMQELQNVMGEVSFVTDKTYVDEDADIVVVVGK